MPLSTKYIDQIGKICQIKSWFEKRQKLVLSIFLINMQKKISMHIIKCKQFVLMELVFS
ncbi:MAG: hypothetical protein BWY04_00384 [candidate division CPR1 bacterium ADurb.Bin160]|uniref:Uncharacterized protein n=1 Tax=candidate division CPR1 bacterium ADurb.Bin160 TaxID=1852826 RepID=A0A1V5ZPJ3_9BACT|nr:MAG: hypothetical protein BWY04_00384 [candidate division CPR1 bacterium ADurb.Bin160]